MGGKTFSLKADAGAEKPILLRVDHVRGHGMGSTRAQHDLEYSDKMSFLLWQDGDPEFQFAAGGPCL